MFKRDKILWENLYRNYSATSNLTSVYTIFLFNKHYKLATYYKRIDKPYTHKLCY